MRKLRFEILALIITLMTFNSAGINAQVQRETRAVWIATNFRLDWPPARYDEKLQKSALAEIFDDIKKKNFNTVYFQVRFNGTVLFKSSYEPMSFYITGKLGDTTAYDPLQYAIELAHKRGIELHAWVNINKCFDGTEKNLLENPKHICQTHPDWIVKDTRDGATAYWLDPGLPEVREYVTGLITELVQDYDIDGIHYDYLRYPGKSFDDDFSFGVHGAGVPRDDWRRNNLTDLVRTLSKSIREIKPTLKIGVAPIGIYKSLPGARGLEGYTDVYQDSREWLKQKYIDYVVPQIYWGFDGNPKFDIVAKDWNDNSYGRSVVLGIGAYKPEVYVDIDKMIELSRKLKSGGVAFFRYKNIRSFDFDLFSGKAFPAPMAWLDGAKPNPPAGLNYEFIEGRGDFVKLTWKLPETTNSEDSIQYYSLYSIPMQNSKPVSDDLFEIIGADRNNVTLGIKRPKKINYYFTLKSVTKLWNESAGSSNIITVKFPELANLVAADEAYKNPMLIRERNELPKVLLYMPAADNVVISAVKGEQVSKISECTVAEGKNIITIKQDIKDISAILVKYKNAGREIKIEL